MGNFEILFAEKQRLDNCIKDGSYTSLTFDEWNRIWKRLQELHVPYKHIADVFFTADGDIDLAFLDALHEKIAVLDGMR